MIKGVRTAVKKTLASLALLSFELVIALVLFIAALFVFILFANLIFNLENETYDFLVFDKIQNWVSPGATRFMQFITFFGNHKFLIPANVVLIFYFLFIRKHRWYSIKIPVIAIGGVSIMLLLKQFFNRPRPLTPLLEPVQGLSFPSGHALMSMSFYGMLIFLVWENVKNKTVKWLLIILLLAFIILIGFSRIYLRLHYFSDVMAGFAVGIIWLSLSIWVLRRMERYSRRELDPVVSKPVTE
jgi:undecaprenyl-diphosphatase